MRSIILVLLLMGCSGVPVVPTLDGWDATLAIEGDPTPTTGHIGATLHTSAAIIAVSAKFALEAPYTGRICVDVYADVRLAICVDCEEGGGCVLAPAEAPERSE